MDQLGPAQTTFRGAFRSRIKRGGFAYAALAVFYCFDVLLTVALLSGGRLHESNLISRQVLLTGGTLTWVAFRLGTLILVTVLVAASLSLTSVIVSLRAPGKRIPLDPIEDVVVGAITLFYAFAILHNLLILARFS